MLRRNSGPPSVLTLLETFVAAVRTLRWFYR